MATSTSSTADKNIPGILINTDYNMKNVDVAFKDIGPILGCKGKNGAGLKTNKCNHLDNCVLYYNDRSGSSLNFIASIIALKPVKGSVIFSDGTKLTSQRVLEIFFEVQKMVQSNPKMAAALQTNADFRDNAADALVKIGEIANKGKITPADETQSNTSSNGATTNGAKNLEPKIPDMPRLNYIEGGVHYLVGASYD